MRRGQKVTGGAQTEWLTAVPTVTNGDTLGIRPDLISRKISSWADVLSPEFKGKAAIQDNPAIGVIDIAMALEARGDIKYGNKGNMTKEEIDKTIKIMMEIKQSGQFRSFWTSFDQSVNLMASGRGGDPVDVVARRRRGAVPWHSLHVPAVEGRLSRLGIHAGRDEAHDGAEAGLLL